MLYRENGKMYRGGWQNNMYHGKGTLKFNYGASMIVEGNFNEGKLVFGNVKVLFKKGEYYEGKMN